MTYFSRFFIASSVKSVTYVIVAKTAEHFIPNSPVTHAKIFEMLNYNKDIIKC